jgi:hypothetical protein
MKVQDLAPTVTPFKDGQVLKASTWSSTDDIVWLGNAKCRRRTITKVNTVMAEFHSAWDADFGVWDSWTTKVVSTGWGSNSDAKGINQIFAKQGVPIRMARKAGVPNYFGTSGNVIELGCH